MTDYDIAILNDAIKTLIDSREGYETCCNLVGDAHPLSGIFQWLIDDRQSLTIEMQDAVERSGGQAEDAGSLSGALHRIFALFRTIFREDEQAALTTLKDGEIFLSQKLQERLDDVYLASSTKTLLQKALNSAKDGEQLAAQLTH